MRICSTDEKPPKETQWWPRKEDGDDFQGGESLEIPFPPPHWDPKLLSYREEEEQWEAESMLKM